MAKVHQRAKKKTPTQHVPLISEALTVIYLLFGIHPVLMFSPFKCRAVAYFCVRSPVWSQDRDGSESGNWQRNQKKVCAPSPHQRRLLKPRLLLNSLSLRHRGKRSMWRREREGETSPEWEKRDEIKHISP